MTTQTTAWSAPSNAKVSDCRCRRSAGIFCTAIVGILWRRKENFVTAFITKGSNVKLPGNTPISFLRLIP